MSDLIPRDNNIIPREDNDQTVVERFQEQRFKGTPRFVTNAQDAQDVLEELGVAIKMVDVIAEDRKEGNELDDDSIFVLNKLDLTEEDIDDLIMAKDMLLKDPKDRDAIRITQDINNRIMENTPTGEVSVFTMGGGFEHPDKSFLDNPKEFMGAYWDNFTDAVYRRFYVDSILRDNELAMDFYDKQGFESKLIGEEVWIRDRDDPDDLWEPANPDGFQLGDIVGYGLDILGSAAAVGASAAAPQFAIPITAGIAGGIEATRQAFRPAPMDIPLIAGEVATSAAIDLTTAGAGKVLKLGSKMTSLFDRSLKEGAEDIIAAGKLLDVEVPPFAVAGKASMQEAGKELRKPTVGATIPPLMLGRKAKKQTQKLRDVIQEEASSFAEKAGGKTQLQVAREAKDVFFEEIEDKVEAAKSLYDKALPKEITDTIKVGLEVDELVTFFDKLKDDFKGNIPAIRFIDQLTKESDKLDNLSQLVNFQKGVGAELAEVVGGASGQQISIAKQIYGETVEAIDSALAKKIANESNTPAGKFLLEKRDILVQAKKQWQEANQDIDAIIKRPGAKIDKPLQEKIGKLETEKSAKQFLRTVFDENDLEKLEFIRDRFPKTFEKAEEAAAAKIFDVAFEGGQFVPDKTIAVLKKMDPSSRAILFGKEQAEKMNAMVLLFDAMDAKHIKDKIPEPWPWAIITDTLNNSIRTMKTTLSRAASKTEQDALSRMANFLTSKKGRTILQSNRSTIIDDVRKELKAIEKEEQVKESKKRLRNKRSK